MTSTTPSGLPGSSDGSGGHGGQTSAETPPRGRRRAKATPFSRLLRYHRTNARLSQMSLSLAAEISTRHLSYLETGKSKPSRTMIAQLAQALELPHRDANALMQAAGFAPMYRQTSLEAQEMAPFRSALEFILQRQEPYPAVLIDRYWNLLKPNAAAATLLTWLVDGAPPGAPGDGGTNTLRWLFDGVLRSFVENWEPLASELIQRVHRDVLGEHDVHMQALLHSLLAAPEVPAGWRRPDLTRPPAPIVPMVLVKDGVRLSFFSVLTTVGTAQDITLQEIRVETFFPADPETDAWVRERLATPSE